MTISVRLNKKDEELVKAYAKMNNISLSDLVRNAIMEKIENAICVYEEEATSNFVGCVDYECLLYKYNALFVLSKNSISYWGGKWNR